jgi:mannosyl-3-phosphoglycerate phosphatase
VKPIVVFTDLDETLLERGTYSFEPALPALRALADREVPVVIVTSKTKAEVDVYGSRLDNEHPFVVENGGGIFIPEGYFNIPHKAAIESISDPGMEGYDVITIGTPYPALRKAMEQLRALGFDVRGFGDMDAEEISVVTALPVEEAARAKLRHFDEPFMFDGDAEALAAAVRELGLHLTQGRLYHLLGENDKGKAVEILKKLYREELGDVAFIALGDSPTDEPMLRRVDYPVLVQKDDGTYDDRVSVPNLVRAPAPGPEGWNRAVLELLDALP